MNVCVCVQSFLDARQDFLNVADAVVRAPLLWRASYVQELGLLDQVRQRQHTKMVMSCCTKQNKTKQNKTAVCGFNFCTRLYCQVNFVLEGDDVEMTWRGFKASTVTAKLTLNCQSHITTVLNDSLTAQRLDRRRIDGWWAIWRST